MSLSRYISSVRPAFRTFKLPVEYLARSNHNSVRVGVLRRYTLKAYPDISILSIPGNLGGMRMITRTWALEQEQETRSGTSEDKKKAVLTDVNLHNDIVLWHISFFIQA
jgi:hypothetical protein